MADIGKLYELLTARPRLEWSDEQRSEAWKRMVRHSIEVAEKMHYAGAVDEARVLVLQIDGGRCPKCGADLEPVTVDNPYALGTRYRFLCRCFGLDREIEEQAGRGTRVFINGSDLDRKVRVRCDAVHGGERCDETVRIPRESRTPLFDDNGIPRYPRYYCEKHSTGSGTGYKRKLRGAA